MSDPISDLKHELLAAAVRQQSHAATGREWTRAHSRRRWVIVAVAGLVLVGGLLVTPALGIGDRLLSLIQGKPTPLDVQAPAWSPDGRTIVFVSWRDGNGEVYAMDADGSAPRNLTQHPAKDVRPAWSPDGRRIAFVSSRDGKSEVYVMNADGSGKRNLTRDRASDDYPTWSPDGRRIAFVRGVDAPQPTACRRFYSYQLYVVNADGSGLRRLTRNPKGYSLVSWSGRRTGGRSTPGATSSTPTGAERGGSVHPVDRRLVARRDGGSPSRANRTGAATAGLVRAAGSHSDIYVMNADGSGTRKLTHNALQNAEPAWSPDGRKIAFVSREDGNAEIYVMNADGSGKRNLTRNPAKDVRPSWSRTAERSRLSATATGVSRLTS